MQAESPTYPARFMLDHMVIRLGKYLRVIGYDAEWDIGIRTHDLIQRANTEGRIFITRNSHLAEQFPPVQAAIVLSETDPALQFGIVVKQLGLDTQSRLFSRCILCNVELGAITEKQEVETRVHPNVYLRHDRFFRCPQCDTIFWHGSHVANTCRKLGLSLPKNG